MSKQPIVELIWRDAYGDADWHHVDEKDIPIIVNSAGYLIGEDKNYYHLAVNIVHITEKVANTVSIPKGCVVSIKYFRGKNVRNRKNK